MWKDGNVLYKWYSRIQWRSGGEFGAHIGYGHDAWGARNGIVLHYGVRCLGIIRKSCEMAHFKCTILYSPSSQPLTHSDVPASLSTSHHADYPETRSLPQPAD